jgi:hypothetical protein
MEASVERSHPKEKIKVQRRISIRLHTCGKGRNIIIAEWLV